MRQLAGRRVFVRTAITPGRPPLLLIHGYPTASYDWVRVWPRLAARHSLYALDLLGFGRSEKPRDTDYPIELQADLCMALLDDRGVGNAHVLAHDYGDTVAQELLAREREGQLRIASMAFLNGGLFPETHRARPIQKLLANPLLGPLLARAMGLRQVRADHAVDRRPRAAVTRGTAGPVGADRARWRARSARATHQLHGAAPAQSSALGGCAGRVERCRAH